MQVIAALGVAGRRKDALSVLDVGGGNGAYFKALSPYFPRLTWTVFETVEMARAVQAAPGVEMLTDRNQLRSRHFDTILISGALQYMADPERELENFSTLAPFTILTRVPISDASEHKPMAQRIGRSSLPVWIMSRDRFEKAMAGIGSVIMRWDVPEDRALVGFKTLPYEGFLIERHHARP